MRGRWYRGSVLFVVVVSASGCWFKGTSAAVARADAEAKASKARREAVERKDFATAIAYDDAFLMRAGADDERIRTTRKNHFVQLIHEELDKLGPLGDNNAEAVVATLITLRRQSRSDLVVPPLERDFSGQPFAAEIMAAMTTANKKYAVESTVVRKADFAIVDADVIAPKLQAAADPLWRVIDAKAAKGELARAIDLGQNLVDELPPGNAYVTRLAQLKARAAAVHIAVAQQAGDNQPGARVMHARIAANYGGQVGTLADPGAALLAEIKQNWTIVSPPVSGSCGDSTGMSRDLSKSDAIEEASAAYREPIVNLETRLRGSGFKSGPGQPMTMTVTFDSCTVTPASADQQTNIPYKESKEVEVPVHSQLCSPSTTSTTSRYLPGDRIQYTTYTTAGACVDTGSIDHYEKHTVVVDKVATLTIHRENHTIKATGTIRIVTVDGTRDERFDLEAVSETMMSWPKIEHGPDGKVGIPLTEEQARDRLHRQLLVKIRALAGKALEARAAIYTTKARAAVAAAQTLEADQAYFIANQINQITGTTDPSFTAWMDTTYHLTAAVVEAAVAELPLPKYDLAATRPIAVKPVAILLEGDIESGLSEGFMHRQRRGVLTMSITAGLASGTTTGGGSTKAGIVSFGFTLSSGSMKPKDRAVGLAAGGGLHMSGGVDGSGTGLLDIDFFLGYGVRLGWLTLLAVGGAGGDGSPGNDADSKFVIPGGAYVEYGLRAAYAFERTATMEVMYTRAVRTSDTVPRENRGDIRVQTVLPGGFPLGLTLRYAEYLTTREWVPLFHTEDRAAKLFWILGGIGF
jgi:hypothetical protein